MVVIVISGMPGCGSTTTGALLAEKLGLKFFSAGSYTKQIARDEEKIDGKETERIIHFWNTIRGKSSKHHMSVEELQKQLVKEGDIIIESKLGIHFLEADSKVWLKAPEEVRALRYVKRDGISLADAVSFLRKKESAERDNWKRIYDFDYFSQEKEADIVIDTSDKTPEEIVEIIIKAIGNKK
jgi:cytidylate kinase